MAEYDIRLYLHDGCMERTNNHDIGDNSDLMLVSFGRLTSPYPSPTYCNVI